MDRAQGGPVGEGSGGARPEVRNVLDRREKRGGVIGAVIGAIAGVVLGGNISLVFLGNLIDGLAPVGLMGLYFGAMIGILSGRRHQKRVPDNRGRIE